MTSRKRAFVLLGVAVLVLAGLTLFPNEKGEIKFTARQAAACPADRPLRTKTQALQMALCDKALRESVEDIQKLVAYPQWKMDIGERQDGKWEVLIRSEGYLPSASCRAEVAEATGALTITQPCRFNK